MVNIIYHGKELSGGGGAAIPTGLISIWYGAVDSIPDGWALCDGTNGTPDLRDRFVLGAGSKYGVGAKGGEEAVTLTVDQMPKHDHVETEKDMTQAEYRRIYPKTMAVGISTDYQPENVGEKKFSYSKYTADDLITSSDGFETRGSLPDYRSTYAGSNKGYAMKTYQTGGGSAHNNMPPYYALCYIMKL